MGMSSISSPYSIIVSCDWLVRSDILVVEIDEVDAVEFNIFDSMGAVLCPAYIYV